MQLKTQFQTFEKQYGHLPTFNRRPASLDLFNNVYILAHSDNRKNIVHTKSKAIAKHWSKFGSFINSLNVNV